MAEVVRRGEVVARQRVGRAYRVRHANPRTTTIEVVHRVLTAIGIARPVVVGHSVSSLIATFYAAHYLTRGVVTPWPTPSSTTLGLSTIIPSTVMWCSRIPSGCIRTGATGDRARSS